jgi:hypothetical protein
LGRFVLNSIRHLVFIFLLGIGFFEVGGVKVVLDGSWLSPGPFVNLFDFIEKSNNVFGQSDVFVGLLFGGLILVKGQHEKPVFEVLGRV